MNISQLLKHSHTPTEEKKIAHWQNKREKWKKWRIQSHTLDPSDECLMREVRGGIRYSLLPFSNSTLTPKDHMMPQAHMYASNVYSDAGKDSGSICQFNDISSYHSSACKIDPFIKFQSVAQILATLAGK